MVVSLYPVFAFGVASIVNCPEGETYRRNICCTAPAILLSVDATREIFYDFSPF
jgi:hypothetical protein